MITQEQMDQAKQWNLEYKEEFDKRTKHLNHEDEGYFEKLEEIRNEWETEFPEFRLKYREAQRIAQEWVKQNHERQIEAKENVERMMREEEQIQSMRNHSHEMNDLSSSLRRLGFK